jgi:hypothetical protein
MSRAPRITEHPGAGRIREQTLDEYLAVLPADHLAREELSDIRAMALSGMKAINELVETNKKLRELETKLLAGEPVPSADKTAAQLYQESTPEKPLNSLAAKRSVPGLAKISCPYCTKPINPNPGPWAAHMKMKHMDQPFLHPYESHPPPAQ